jgi:hypothetical protein
MYFEEKSNDPQYIFDCFWNEVDQNFSFFSYLNLNWDSVYAVYQPQITDSTTPNELADILGRMILLLKDGHSNLFTNYGTYSYSGWYSKYPENVISNISSYLTGVQTKDKNLYWGHIKSANLGYINIKTFTGDTSAYSIIDDILTEFADKEGIIIDVRSNGGGNASNGTTIAKRFADTVRLVNKSRYRNGAGHEDFTPWIADYLIPGGKVHYTKPVAILTNRQCFSATGWFLLEMVNLPQVTIIGDTTGGGSAQPVVRELPNGWIVRLSNSQRINNEGYDDQYSGLYPDIPVWISSASAKRKSDSILERAILELTK